MKNEKIYARKLQKLTPTTHQINIADVFKEPIM